MTVKEESVVRMTAAMKKRDEAAWRSFHRAYFDRLFRYQMVLQRGDEDRAADLVQQTMLRVVRHIRRFDDESSFWSWLTCLSRSAAADEGRSWLRRLRWFEQLVHLTEFRRNTDDPMAERVRKLDQCLASLSPDDRGLVEGKYFDRRSYADLAKQFEISDKAVESRLARVRAKLRGAIQAAPQRGETDEQ